MPKTKYLTRDEVFEADDLKIEEVKVDEWFGGTLRVRGLNGQGKDDYQISLMVSPGRTAEVNMQNASAKLVALCVIDEDGDLLFQEGDVLLLGKRNGKALDRVFTVAQRLSGMSSEDMEELLRNFGKGQNGDSTSA